MKTYLNLKNLQFFSAKKCTSWEFGPDEDEPNEDGYEVIEADGASWYTKEAFENNFCEIPCVGLPFGIALEAVKSGKGMRLPKWSEDVMIRCQFPDEHSKMTAPYLYVESRFGRVPWKETMIELLSNEWQIVE